MVVDKSNPRVQRMFAEIAGKYDRMNHLLSFNVDRWWRRRTVRLVPPRGAAPILDVCTGTGDLAFAFDRAGMGKAPVVGVDFCREMLDVAEAKRTKFALASNVSFLEADAQDLPFEDDRFQIVSVAFGLRNVADTDRGLREMVRVCQPGGRVAVLEFTMPRRQPLKGLYGWYFRRVLPRIGQVFARNDQAAYNYLPESVGEFPQYEQLLQRMNQAGLRDATLHPLTLGLATLYVGTKPTT